MHQYSDRARRREQPEPRETDRPIPKFVLGLVSILFVWGLAYIFSSTGYPLAGGDRRTAVAEAAPDRINGSTIFSAHCAACHQATGKGVPGAFPPLAGSEWVQASPHLTSAIVLYGIQGPITVSGGSYNGTMPTFGKQLSSAEIAAVLSYVRSSWGNRAGPVEATIVAETRTKYGDNHAPWKGGKELRSEFKGP